MQALRSDTDLSTTIVLPQSQASRPHLKSASSGTKAIRLNLQLDALWDNIAQIYTQACAKLPEPLPADADLWPMGGEEVSLSKALSQVTELSRSLNDVSSSLAFLSRPTTQSNVAAMDVFGIPKLLEMVTDNLEIWDMLALMQVNRPILAAVQSSAKIYRDLGLDAVVPHTSFYTGFGIPVQTQGPYMAVYPRLVPLDHNHPRSLTEDYETCYAITIRCSATSSRPTRVGQRCRSMFVIQPPLRSVNVSTKCCGMTTIDPVPPGLSSDVAGLYSCRSGITVGHVLDITLTLWQMHRRCPHAAGYLHNSTGAVDVSPTVHSRMDILTADNPMHTRLCKEDARMLAHQQRIQRYIVAKLHAHHAGHAIPTLEKYERDASEAPVSD
ncbi:hypothetical protein LTR56_013354 [Elasticomyces elasticus]|nr:hypothetical protein LTR22_020181 [Elasticomyces elasticus]KAK3637954.1 hypothetical protein LTR56_013354 [Elasticomyces elasticus]KAK4910721.1 hypothetical protein LTR49_020660 [Elasticomyces elasticus]KAK5751464.1 hypothetical protein LTS12_018475 [Elasticomyces elasticus]